MIFWFISLLGWPWNDLGFKMSNLVIVRFWIIGVRKRRMTSTSGSSGM